MGLLKTGKVNKRDSRRGHVPFFPVGIFLTDFHVSLQVPCLSHQFQNIEIISFIIDESIVTCGCLPLAINKYKTSTIGKLSTCVHELLELK